MPKNAPGQPKTPNRSNKPNQPKPRWSSHLVFILACIGSAVGVGNIWRFPYLAGENGGGSFILVYLISILLFGLPILLLELLAGKALSSSPVKSFEKIKKDWVPLYYINFLFVLVIFSYYVVVTSWTLGYFSLSLAGSYIPFPDFSNSFLPLIFTMAVIAILFLVMRVNIKSGLEKINTILPPVLFIALLILLYNAIRLPGFGNALSFYTSVSPGSLLNPSLWVLAISQAIFSLSIGQGIMMAYGSYLSKKAELFRSSLKIVSADTLVSLLACLVVFGFVFTFAIPPNSGPSLSFEALPLAFQQMEFGNILMPLFFLLLFCAAITSAVSLSELVIYNFEDMFGIDRKKATTVCMLLIGILMLPSALSYSPLALSVFGERVLDFLDAKVVGRFLPLTTLIAVAYIAWGYRDLEKEAKANIPAGLVGAFLLMVRFVIPVLLLGLTVLQFV